MSLGEILAAAIARSPGNANRVERTVSPPPPDDDGYVWLRYAADLLGGYQLQYLSRYTCGALDRANLGQGLRFKGSVSDYHYMRIHLEDVPEFVRRVKEHRAAA